jgi:putative heme-binding domain-containing protein
VDGLIARLNKERAAARRQGLLTALCRLYFTEGPWKGDSWGTRPDTRGPYYQPEEWSETKKISSALMTVLNSSDGDEAAFLGREFSRHRIKPGDAMTRLITLAGKDAALLPSVAAQLAQADSVPANAVPLLIQAATAATTPTDARALAAQALVKTDSADGWRAILTAMPMVQASKTENRLGEKTRDAIFASPKLENQHQLFETLAARLDGKDSLWADAALVKLAGRTDGSPEAREMSRKALDAGWADPKRRAQIINAAALAREQYKVALVVAAMNDTDRAVAAAAGQYFKTLKMDPDKVAASAKDAGPQIGTLKIEDVLAAVMKTKGDAAVGELLFTKQSCVNCHTTRADQPPKGPFLGNIAATYQRHDLAENILLPNKTLAQGFVAERFELKDGEESEGFVTLEAADKVVIRNVLAKEVTIPVADIARRVRLQKSIMPEGLVANLTVKEFASLLDYLEALNAKK